MLGGIYVLGVKTKPNKPHKKEGSLNHDQYQEEGENMLISTKAICDKHKCDLEPFFMWGRNFMVCPHCTGAKKSSPKQAPHWGKDKIIIKNIRDDKNKIEKEVWGDKGKIYQSRKNSNHKKVIDNLKRHNKEMRKINNPLGDL